MTTFDEMYDRNVKEARKNLRFSVELSFSFWETLLDIFKGNALDIFKGNATELHNIQMYGGR